MHPKKAMMIGSNERTYSDSKRQMLVPDLIRMILERLDFVAFHKARSLSLDWYSTAELYVRQTPTPWLILFPNDNSGSCKLFDPCENKSHTVTNLGYNFTSSRCLANSGSWFLMLENRTNFYLLNLFTRQRICLPSLEAKLTSYYGNVKIRSVILWVDERSKDYFVVWNVDRFFAYHKKGDSGKCWKVFQLLERGRICVDMLFKDRKIYVLSDSREITVFDFYCGDSPKKCANFPSPRWYHPDYSENLAMTLSGEVLYISSNLRSFVIIYKLDRKSLEWSIVHSLGNEALFLDLRITIAAKDGVEKDSVYFSNDQLNRCNGSSLRKDKDNICIYDIQTKKVVEGFKHVTASSRITFKDGRWFSPIFSGKWLL